MMAGLLSGFFLNSALRPHRTDSLLGVLPFFAPAGALGTMARDLAVPPSSPCRNLCVPWFIMMRDLAKPSLLFNFLGIDITASSAHFLT